MRTARKTASALAAALAAAAFAASAWPAPPMSSETNELRRSAASGGGSREASSASHRLFPVLGEELATSTAPASAANRLGAGLLQVRSSPGRVTSLAERGDVSASSATLTWTTPGYDGGVGELRPGTRYFIRVASYTAPDSFNDHRLADVSFSTSGTGPTQRVWAGVTGLLPNTTYYARLWTADAAGNLSDGSPLSTFTTLALPVTALPESFLAVHFTSVTVHWAARPLSPPDAGSMTASGYLVEASSTDFGALSPGGVVSSSGTTAVSLSTLTVSDPGLIVDRRYYFRVASLNRAGAPNWTLLGSTVTKFQVNDPVPDDPPFTQLSTGSVTARWAPNGNPSNSFYFAQASTAADFTGVVTTTDTFNLSYSTGGLLPNTTYHFQVQATTRAQSSGFAYLGSTMTWSPAPAPAGAPLPDVHASSLTVRWLPNGNPSGQSTYTVVASTSPAYPNEDDGRVIVASTKPAGADPAATLTGLAPNTTYYLFAAAHNGAGAQGSWTLLASTATRPAVPALAGLESVSHSSLTVSWGTNGNPLGVTSYTVVLSTAASYPPGGAWDVSASTLPDATPVVLALEGLRLNATYHAFVTAVGHAHRAGAASFSTATRAADPQADPPSFPVVTETSLTPRWTGGAADPGFNAPAPWTTYYALLADNAAFSPAQRSSVTFDLDAAFAALSPNTTYFARAAAYSHHHGTWTAYAELGSTSTLAAVPVAGSPATFLRVFFTSAAVSWGANGNPPDVSSYAVAFTSGYVYPNSLPDNVEFTTAPAGATLSAMMTGLASNTTYQFYARAVSHSGAATAWVALGSTRTLNSPKTWVGGSGSSWHTAANWNPAGVPSFTDAVTIAQNVSVTALSPISFSSLTLGSPSGAVAAGLHLSSTTGQAGDVLIHKGAGLTQNTTHQLVFTGDFTMMSGSSLTHTSESATSISSVNVRVTGIFDLQAGATINVVGKGYRGGAVDANGVGPGAGTTDTANNEGGGGGGYGEAGGDGVGAPGGQGGAAYGSSTFPIHMGSGGGGAGNAGTGGAGGGIVIIDAATMVLDGVILSSGGAGRGGVTGTTAAGGGGGSGGGVNITAGSFSGTGSIDVSGGPGGVDDVGPGGGGGGGRVAVTITGGGTACGLTVTRAGGASGGGAAQAGTAGSFFDGSLLAAPALAGSPQSATSIDWSWSLVTGATDYQLFSSTGGPMSPPLGAAASYTTTGLAVNTTAQLYVQARACDANSADSAADAVSTLALVPAADAPSFRAVATASLGVAWAANGNPAGITTYTVVLSTDAVYPNSHEGTVTLSSFMAGAAGATPAGLQPNTTYHLFVAAVNHAGLTTAFAGLGATATLTALPTGLPETFVSVYTDSITVAWAALASGQGYLLEVSSTNFGTLSPGGLVVSSLTFAVGASTLALSFPDVAVSTNYYRVSGLNWNGAPGPSLFLGKMNIQVDPSVLTLELGAVDMTVDVATVSVSSFVVYNRGDIAVTYMVSGDTNTAGTPWTLGETPGIERAVLQGLWNGGPPAPPHAAFSSVISSNPRVSGASVYAGDQNAVLVPPGEGRPLWFRFRLPASTIENGPQQLRVSVTPVKP